MSVYVDPATWPFGRMVMCHMWADSLDELYAMVDAIGVRRKWLQEPPKASWVHFDVSKNKRAEAVTHGAIETDRYGALYWAAANKGEWHKMELIEQLRAQRIEDEKVPL